MIVDDDRFYNGKALCIPISVLTRIQERKVRPMIERLFLEKDQVSLQKDILPVVLKEFGFESMNADNAYTFVKQSLYALHIQGVYTVCYPIFDYDPSSGLLSVVDMVWEKAPKTV